MTECLVSFLGFSFCFIFSPFVLSCECLADQKSFWGFVDGGKSAEANHTLPYISWRKFCSKEIVPSSNQAFQSDNINTPDPRLLHNSFLSRRFC